MKNKLEEQMRETMDGASLKDLMPDFDREGFWNELQPAIVSEKTKGIIPVRWMSYAAAVLLLIVAGYIVTHFPGNEYVANEAGITLQKAIVPALSDKPDKSTANPNLDKVRKHEEDVAVNPTQKIAQPQPLEQQILANDDNNILRSKINDSESVATVISTKETVVVAAPQRKVTHYLDIDEVSEPAARMVASNPPLIQMKMKRPDPSDQNLQQKPLREFAMAFAR